MKKILTVLTVIAFTIVSCQKEEPVEPQVAATTSSSSSTGNTGGADPTVSADKFFVGINLTNSMVENGVDYPDVTINGVPLSYVGENYNTLNVNNGVIERAFEYSIPNGLVNCNDSIDYGVVFNDAEIVGVTILDIQVFSHMDGYDIECLNPKWGGIRDWEKPTSVPYVVGNTPKIKYICN